MLPLHYCAKPLEYDTYTTASGASAEDKLLELAVPEEWRHSCPVPYDSAGDCEQDTGDCVRSELFYQRVSQLRERSWSDDTVLRALRPRLIAALPVSRLRRLVVLALLQGVPERMARSVTSIELKEVFKLAYEISA